jgi:hypothetical protein
VENNTTSPALSAKDVNKLQQLTGTLFYYARAVDPTLIMPINTLASQQTQQTNSSNSPTTATLIQKPKYGTMHLI